MTPDTLLEHKLWNQGYKIVVGIDEAGRGPWAGPVSAGAVCIDPKSEILAMVHDSKKMRIDQRENIFDHIKDSCIGWGIGLADSGYIDQYGIQLAVQKAMRDALIQVEEMVGNIADILIIDGKSVLDIQGYESMKMNKGDAMHYSIACASILAKVHRDRLMVEYSKEYPQYGFESHMGYGTKLHREALKLYGITPIHRKSYRPIKELL